MGDGEFLDAARDLLFGFSKSTAKRDLLRVASVQSISGTGANHFRAMLIARDLKSKTVWLPGPTWNNHHTIWELASIEVREYPYYDRIAQALDLQGMVATLTTRAKPGDVVVLHACAHNPTGTDPTKDQWKQIAEIFKHLNLFAFFDLAYQGFATGDVDEDAWPVRHFFHQSPQINICVAQSFSKNFGLYGQSVGACHVVLADSSRTSNTDVISKLSRYIRAEFSMAPRAGSAIVKQVLGDPELQREWRQNLIEMTGRLKGMRGALYSSLTKLGTPGSWYHLVSQVLNAHPLFGWCGFNRHRLGCSLTRASTPSKLGACGTNTTSTCCSLEECL